MTKLGQRGFTLIEAIIAMVITGIVAGIVSVFMVIPINSYLDTVNRAALTDVADTTLRRMGYELRGAVPNTVRLASTSATGLSVCVGGAGANCYLELVPAADGGRYRALAGAAGDDPLDATSSSDDCFDVLGPAVSIAENGFLVIFNTGQTGLNAYAGDNRRRVPAAAVSCPAPRIRFEPASPAAAFPPYESPSQRFQYVSPEGPLSFACLNVGSAGAAGKENGTGELRRFAAYAGTASWDPQPNALAAGGALLADQLSACVFRYDSFSAASGLVGLELEVKRNGEAVKLVHQIHVDNTP